jgi:hypothetical protein
MSSYQPGQCNIGRSEIRRRKFLALIGAILTLLSSVGLIASKAPRLDRLVLIIPAMAFSMGLVQSAKRFCVAYGALGVYHFDSDERAITIADQRARKADRNAALTIFLQSFLIAALMTLIVFLLP